ncbi:hypothetical protein JHK82_052808 [Glycine max]|nr:hypothetical protein JHK86_052661 [Glycine max]KAG4927026.1 hypothetical protein JHK85_053512 [Glycine max]KAG5082653.1 hypothetical protein JHK84_052691 [Glycine max]KAG5085411.1 hypothetical protein JHK82_052808 [Glycine max]
MGRYLEIVEKENREMKRLLDEMKLGRNNRLEESKGGGRKLGESNGEVQRWRSYKSERQEKEKKMQQPNKNHLKSSAFCNNLIDCTQVKRQNFPLVNQIA